MTDLKFEPALKAAQRTRQERKKVVKKMPLAHFLWTHEIPIINRDSVRAYQRAYKHTFIEAKLKKLDPGKFWSFRCILGILGYLVAFALALFSFPNAIVFHVLATVVFLAFVVCGWEHREAVRTFPQSAEWLGARLQQFARWEVVPFSVFGDYYCTLKALPRMPGDVSGLASRVERGLPGARVFVEYFEQDPFLFVEFGSGETRESYYIAVWGQEGFTHGEV